MALYNYDNYLQINPTFESVVDIGSDSRNKNLWREYIVGDDMEKLVDALCQTLGYETPDARRSLWIHGSYGTGKSYAAILIKHLLEEKPEIIAEYLQNNHRLSQYKNRFMNCRKNGDYMVIWKTGCTGIRTGDQLLIETEFAIRERLIDKFGDKADLGSASLRDAVKAQFNNKSINWDHVIDSTILGEKYDNLEDLSAKIDEGDLNAIQSVAEIIRNNHWGLINNVETFKKWVTEVINANHLENSGIYFIWDEFTDYLRYGDDQVVLQQISEFCKESPLFMCFIVHKDSGWVDAMGNNTYQQITHRFHEVEFHVSPDAAYDLIAGSISVRNGMENNWIEARKDPIRNIKKYLPEMEGLDDKISSKIEALCPMHPMTVRLLSQVAENFAAAQRTMFRFMKDSSNNEQGFLGYIQKYGPSDQACWLTPEWLWDYFFTRESDFHDKDTKAPEFIRHYEENRYLVESDANAYRLFKTSLLLMAIMSSTKGFFVGKRSNNGISSTVDCLVNCYAGVLSERQIKDYLATFKDLNIIIQDQMANGITRLQLPFKSVSGDDFDNRFGKNDKLYTRYQMFANGGKLATPFLEQAQGGDDAMSYRTKVVVCCAEKTSMDKRIGEVLDELGKYPYKLGIVYVTVKDDAQANAIQQDIERRAHDSGQKRLIIALVRQPFTDEMRKQWLTSLTKDEMAKESGSKDPTYANEANTIILKWVGQALSGGKIYAWSEDNYFTNIYGVNNLRKTIQTNILNEIFPYAPESICSTGTAYKKCNENAPLAGIQRKAISTQYTNVLDTIKQLGLSDQYDIHKLIGNDDGKSGRAISALAKLVCEKMESGQKVNLRDLWSELQQAPFGYHNSIICGILLGFVFSCYKDSAYSWVNSSDGSFVLDEKNLKSMVLATCKGEATTDYLSAGSVTWQKFRDYIKRIFALSDAQTANEVEGMRSVREKITAAGAPFWSLKYLDQEEYGSDENAEISQKIIDNIQIFITQEGNTDEAMNNVLQSFTGRGKLRAKLEKSFQDKFALSKAFQNFLFTSSPELKEITGKLSVQPEALWDKVSKKMQGEVYSWTEPQVQEKLADVVSEYQYLDALNHSMQNSYHSPEEAIKDLRNAFNHMRVAVLAIEPLSLNWYNALAIFQQVAESGINHKTVEERKAEIDILSQYGSYAWDCIKDSKPVLTAILEHRQLDCTQQELDTIFSGLKDVSYNATILQFDKELNTQINKISQSRNRTFLKEKWTTISSTESVKEWCNQFGIPLLWIVPRNLVKPIQTLMSVQAMERTIDQDVVNALNELTNMDSSILVDINKAEKEFLKIIGEDYKDFYLENKKTIFAQLKFKLGNDVSAWGPGDVYTVQKVLKDFKTQKDREEKLANTQLNVENMQERELRDKVKSFLKSHPEYCDNFS